MKLRESLGRLFAWRPPVIGSAEAVLLRLGMALIIWFLFFASDPRFESQPHPHALGHVFDFTFLSNPDTWQVLKIVLAIALTAYVAGLALPLSLGYVVWLMIAYGTLKNSQGSIHHGTQALATATLAQWVAYVIAAARDRRAWLSLFRLREAHTRAYFYAQQAVVAGYLCAAIVKIDRGKPAWSLGLHWVEQIPNMAIQVTRNGVQNFYNYANNTAAMEHGARIGNWIAENPNLARLLFFPGLYLELLVFFALFNRRLAFLFGVALVVMHWLIAWTMQLSFELNQFVIALLFINVPYLLVAAGDRLSDGRFGLLPEETERQSPSDAT